MSIYALISTLLIAAFYIFLIYRLSFFSRDRVSGRMPFLWGGITLFLASCWWIIKTLPAYNDWFIISAYPVLDFFHFMVSLIGAVLTIIGLSFFADYWQTSREDLETREQKLSLLRNLQKDAREPYHLIGLFEISLKEIVSQLDGAAGAVFMVNRSRRQLVLTGSAGLNKKEIALLEHYPLGQNLISQVVELGDPMLSGEFNFDLKNQSSENQRFQSTLILPMISGNDQIGVMLLLSENKQAFSSTEIKYLMPVVEWLAEKINSARLTRELKNYKRNSESELAVQRDFEDRIASLGRSFFGREALSAFCRALVGVANCSAVHIYSLQNGLMKIYDGSEPLTDLTENYKTALIDALDRDKPIVINQEAAGADGKSYISRSTLVYPIKQEQGSSALLLIREGAVISIDDKDIRIIEIYAGLARLALQQEQFQKYDITRRRGLEKIVELMRTDNKTEYEDQPAFFIRHMKSVLPEKTIALSLTKSENNNYQVVEGLNLGGVDPNEFKLLVDEGVLTRIRDSVGSYYLYGKNEIAQAVSGFDELNRDLINRTFGERGVPQFMALCPFYRLDEMVGGIVFFMYNLSDKEQKEWQRLLTLAAGLYTIRLTVTRLAMTKITQPEVVITGDDPAILAESLNQLNNHLTTILGNAELAAAADNNSDELNNYYDKIISETEKAADFLKQTKNSIKVNPVTDRPKDDEVDNLRQVLEDVLKDNHISEGLYMAGGRPFEIDLRLNHKNEVAIKSIQLGKLFEDALNRFAAWADETDIITVSTYSKDQMVYLDLSRHHKNFPPVQAVADFSRYFEVDYIVAERPADRFLEHILGTGAQYAFDRESNRPTYLSFSMPFGKADGQQTAVTRPHILAVDDQPLILDLIKAMGQSSGYDIDTASGGQIALEKAQSKKYDLVLTDLSMPGMSGLELTKVLKQNQPDLPVILITGWGMHLDEEQLAQAGISEVLYKPFKIEQLTELINNLLIQQS